ncbi:MAG TPA: carbohydrate ABC transporter permease [Ktedonobacteraceae bacterium]|nr:carbohydrate ABC transporter permease [Ktedonobacteraceae bacterium]
MQISSTNIHKKFSDLPARRREATLTRSGKYLVLFFLVVIFVCPFLWLIITALKTPAEMAAFPVRFFPDKPAWNNFVQAFTSINFPAYTMNSLILSTIFATLVTISSALVGFGFARLRGPGKRILFLLMLSTIMLPSIVTLIPTYVLFARLNLVNTYWPWVLWGLGASPFLVFLFRQFFSAIPAELEEAAILDGCSYGRIFWRIFLPLSVPVIVTSFLISFMGVWGDFITPTLLLNPDNTTLAVAMSTGYLDPHGTALTNIQAAGSVLYVIPGVVIFFFAQRYFVQGIVTSGLKS